MQFGIKIKYLHTYETEITFFHMYYREIFAHMCQRHVDERY